MTLSEKNKKPRLGITLKLIICFLAFTGITLLLLWVFQITLLDTFYKNITERSIKKHAESIATNIKNENIYELAIRIVQEGDISIRVVYFSGGTSFEAHMSDKTSLFQSLSSNELYALYSKALNEGGSCTVTYNLDSLNQFSYNFHDFLGPVPKTDSRISENIIYVKAVEKDSVSAAVYICAPIYPVDSTVNTLKIQLICVTAIMVVLSILIAVIISRVISRPIINLNNSAKSLATADYSTTFNAGGCRELAELSDTLNYTALELGKVDKLKTELIANISHDLRTPLTLISGYAEMMRDIPGEMNEENLLVISQEAQRLSSLVSDVLDLSKIQSGTQTLSMSHFSLTAAIRDIIGRYSKFLSQSGYSIIFHPHQEVFVYADEIRISQVIYNLVSNAVHYTGNDKTVLINQICCGDNVRIEVCDSGEGISQESLPFIWDRYYKIDREHRRNQLGSGLGLSIVKGILEQHSAAFGVSSELGAGSIFWFSLPISEEM